MLEAILLQRKKVALIFLWVSLWIQTLGEKSSIKFYNFSTYVAFKDLLLKRTNWETCSEIHYMLYIGFFASFKSNEFSAW